MERKVAGDMFKLLEHAILKTFREVSDEEKLSPNQKKEEFFKVMEDRHSVIITHNEQMIESLSLDFDKDFSGDSSALFRGRMTAKMKGGGQSEEIRYFDVSLGSTGTPQVATRATRWGLPAGSV